MDKEGRRKKEQGKGRSGMVGRIGEERREREINITAINNTTTVPCLR